MIILKIILKTNILKHVPYVIKKSKICQRISELNIAMIQINISNAKNVISKLILRKIYLNIFLSDIEKMNINMFVIFLNVQKGFQPIFYSNSTLKLVIVANPNVTFVINVSHKIESFVYIFLPTIL